MRILVTGGTGYLGSAVIRLAMDEHEVVGTSRRTRPAVREAQWHHLDIRNRPDVVDLVHAVRPDIIVHTAYVKSDWSVTADGAAHIAAAAVSANARLVHVSSDAVFSGAGVTYDETALPDPITPYGAAKAAAETAVKGIDPAAAIVRTSLILGDGDSPHERLVHDLASGRREGHLYVDDVRCPVHVADLSSAILELAISGRPGMHHIAGADALSRYELGRLIAARGGLDPRALRPGQRAGGPAVSPLDVRLNSERTCRMLRTAVRGARSFLATPATA